MLDKDMMCPEFVFNRARGHSAEGRSSAIETFVHGERKGLNKMSPSISLNPFHQHQIPPVSHRWYFNFNLQTNAHLFAGTTDFMSVEYQFQPD
ncbi:MAG TPA: hypothetical protein VIG25_20480 [Pyrinomonadaceae bacterium]|jgi:hypothetical protein